MENEHGESSAELAYWCRRYLEQIDTDQLPGPYDDAELEYCRDSMRKMLQKEAG